MTRARPAGGVLVLPLVASLAAMPSLAADTTLPVVDDADPRILHTHLTGAGGGVFLMRPDGTDVVQLATDVAGSHKHPDWSPDGEHVVFVDDDATGRIWVAHLDGAPTTLLATSRAAITAVVMLTAAIGAGAAAQTPSTPPIEPGEPWLAYTWYPDELYLVRPDGSDRHVVELGVPGEPFAVSWSPDGERLAFVIRDETTPNGSIWTANADGTDLTLLYGRSGECNDGAFWPAWAPDGRRLAMVCYRVQDDAGYSTIAVLDTATMSRSDLAQFTYPQTVDNPPSWSPDGTTLTFEIITWDPTDTFVADSVIATVPAAGGEVTRLTDPALFGGHPDWSPDGSRIAFNTYDTGNIHGIEEPSNVYTIAPDGSDLRQLSTASTDGTMRIGQPFWSSDGSRIWVSIGRDWEKDSTGQFKNTLGWVDAATGALHEIGTEGKRFRERPLP